MSDFDVERITEFEIATLKDELLSCCHDFDNYKDVSSRLVDTLELRIQQLKDKCEGR